LGQVLVGQPKCGTGGAIVPGAEPSFAILVVMHRLEKLADQQGFELSGGFADLLRAVLIIRTAGCAQAGGEDSAD